jgi:hypothetical protein
MQTPPPQDPMPSNYPRQNLADDRQVLREVATAQKQIIYCVLGQVAIGVLRGVSVSSHSGALAIITLLLALPLVVFMLMSVYKLTKAFGESTGTSIIYLVLMFIPCVSLIFLVILIQRATTRLQGAGIKVGFFGADPTSI